MWPRLPWDDCGVYCLVSLAVSHPAFEIHSHVDRGRESVLFSFHDTQELFRFKKNLFF